MDRYGYLKTAAAIPSVRVADCAYNGERIAAFVADAAGRGVEVVLFPELSVTGYTCGDLFLQPALLAAAEQALAELLRRTAELNTAFVVGLPVAVDDMLYNCAVVAAAGEVLGVVPKCHIPDYAEFYESRWFASGQGRPTVEIELCGQSVPFGPDLLFDIGGARCAVEICEDLWVPAPPSAEAAAAGAEVILNLSASPETVGKSDYVRQLVVQQSARTRAAYLYCSAGFGESSTDLVFAGHALVAENGAVLAVSERFSLGEQLVVADVDCQLLRNDRCRTTTFRHSGAGGRTTVAVTMPVADDRPFDRTVEAMPFVPAEDDRRHSRCEEILNIQATGLARRLAHTRSTKAVVGISGGLDSTLALLVTVRAFDRLGLDRQGIVGITMPGFGTTGRTYGNALTLMRGLGVTAREIPIRAACEQHFRDIGLPEDDRSTTYENAQARERTQILMDVANRDRDLSGVKTHRAGQNPGGSCRKKNGIPAGAGQYLLAAAIYAGGIPPAAQQKRCQLETVLCNGCAGADLCGHCLPGSVLQREPPAGDQAATRRGVCAGAIRDSRFAAGREFCSGHGQYGKAAPESPRATERVWRRLYALFYSGAL